MNSEIEEMDKKCPTFLTCKKRQPNKAVISHPIPN